MNFVKPQHDETIAIEAVGKDGEPMAMDDFKAAIAAVTAHGGLTNREYRILVEGDLPSCDMDVVGSMLGALAACGSLVQVRSRLSSRTAEHYRTTVPMLRAADRRTTLDVELDVGRLADDGYLSLVRDAVGAVDLAYVSLPTGDGLVGAIGPEALAARLRGMLDDHCVLLSFDPSATEPVIDYINRYYAAHPDAFRQTSFDVNSYVRAEGLYRVASFQRFRIGFDLSVLPVAHTAFNPEVNALAGDSPLGNLREEPLAAILSGPAVQRLSLHNAVWMDRGEWGCRDCRFHGACEYNGVGLARRHNPGIEAAMGSCLGPKFLRFDEETRYEAD